MKPRLYAGILISYALAHECIGQQTFNVAATENIFGSGHSTLPDPGGGGGGTFPTLIPLSAGLTNVFSFSVTGQVSPYIGYGYFGPDGSQGVVVNIAPVNGISGIKANSLLFLAGVFLTDDEPTNPAPPSLDFNASAIGTSFTVIEPAINQVFFVGDGLTETEIRQTQIFVAPTNATRLYLGFADTSDIGLAGYYDDNIGSLSVIVTNGLTAVVPDTPTLSLSLYAGITIRGSVGGLYEIDYSTSLTSTNWLTLTNIFLPYSPYFFVDTTSTATGAKYYRALGL